LHCKSAYIAAQNRHFYRAKQALLQSHCIGIVLQGLYFYIFKQLVLFMKTEKLKRLEHGFAFISSQWYQTKKCWKVY